jgi:hypothetical protein
MLATPSLRATPSATSYTPSSFIHVIINIDSKNKSVDLETFHVTIRAYNMCITLSMWQWSTLKAMRGFIKRVNNLI